jgi:hypothetical protein
MLLERRGILAQVGAPPFPVSGLLGRLRADSIANHDEFSSDSRANYGAVAGGSTPLYSGSTLTSGTFNGGFYLAAPSAWGNGSDQAVARVKGRATGTSPVFAVGFVTPGSVDWNNALLANLWVGGGVMTVVLSYDGGTEIGRGTLSLSTNTYYIVSMIRNGNNVNVIVKDAADSSVLYTNTFTIPAGAAQTKYGAGVSLRPMFTLQRASSQDTEIDWFEFAANVAGGIFPAIATWPSLNGPSALQATAGNQPTYVASAINGKPGVKFTRSLSKYLTWNLAAERTPFSWLFVFVASATMPTGESDWLYGMSGPDSDPCMSFSGNRACALDNAGWGNLLLAPNGSLAASGSPNALIASVDKASAAACGMYRSGSSIAGAATGLSDPWTAGRTQILGGNPQRDSAYMEGHIAEIAKWDHVLTAPERAAVFGYTLGRYGI